MNPTLMNNITNKIITTIIWKKNQNNEEKQTISLARSIGCRFTFNDLTIIRLLETGFGILELNCGM